MDDLEISRSGSNARVSFDMVDADWVNKYRPFNDASPPILDFESMPLFHLEIVIKLSNYCTFRPRRYLPIVISRALRQAFSPGPWQNWNRPDLIDLNPNPPLWFVIEKTSKGRGHRANLYRNMSGDAESINVEVQPSLISEELDRIFTLPGTPVDRLDPAAIALLGDIACDRIVVFDVGQGNANGLIKDGSVAPELYFDAGAGVYGNFHTRPPRLHLPADNAKVVILSHWDSDHWAGANIPGNDDLLSKTWIAPQQPVGPRHAAFAQRIMDSTGTLLLMERMAPKVQVIPMKGGRDLLLTQGTGDGRNDSGLVACVEATTQDALRRSIILTGDCDYCHFGHLKNAPVKGLVVPHHGASLKSNHSDVPTSSAGQSTLAYSFGPNNAHGKSRVRHPTTDGVKLHSAWHHGGWRLTRPGFGNPGPQVLATCDHTAGAARGSVYLDW
ncbi:hypothetical protein QA447_14000 [Pseudomonas sp. abacavir_1]